METLGVTVEDGHTLVFRLEKSRARLPRPDGGHALHALQPILF